MPVWRQTSAANVQRTLVKNESVRVTEDSNEARRQFAQDLDIVDALASPSNAGNVHALEVAQRPKLSKGGSFRKGTEARQLQPRRSRRVRCSAWLGSFVIESRS